MHWLHTKHLSIEVNLYQYLKDMFLIVDTLTNDQKTYFEMTQARFQHLDYQIEGVQEQLDELYYKHK